MERLLWNLTHLKQKKLSAIIDPKTDVSIRVAKISWINVHKRIASDLSCTKVRPLSASQRDTSTLVQFRSRIRYCWLLSLCVDTDIIVRTDGVGLDPAADLKPKIWKFLGFKLRVKFCHTCPF